MQEDQPAQGATGEPVAPPHGTSESGAEAPVDAATLQAQVQELQERADRMRASWQRAQADLANYRKQVEREQEEVTALASGALLTDLLPLLDDLERALGSVAAELRSYTWIEGIWLIYKKLEAILGGYGIEEVKAQGQPLDPRLHQPVAEVDGEAGMVVGVVQKGYTLRQRLLRPALVTVGRGVSTEAAEEKQQPAEETGGQESPPEGAS